jgi:hypothetical protein
MRDMTEFDKELKTFVEQTAKIAWSELQRFYAQGQVLQVSDTLDLIRVAKEVHDDNKAMVEEWIANEDIVHVSDSQALQWFESDALVWSVVVAPWILVQNISDK